MGKKKSRKSGKKKQKIRYVEVAPKQSGISDGLRAILPDSASSQLMLGILIGGAVSYVLSDEKLRETIIRQGVQGFGNITGSLAELKEQIADIQAEIEAKQAAGS